jgi:hypothetical protein
MELDNIYTTTSTLLILQSAYAVFTNFAGYPGVTFISDVTSPNCRKHLGQKQQQKAPSSTLSKHFGQEQQQKAPSSILKENVPFSRRSKP